MKTLQIYILSSGRPGLIKETIESVLNQIDCGCFDVVVSDNSINNDVSNMISKTFPSVTVIKRDNVLSSELHFKRLLSECNSDYVVFFHDDDLFIDNYCSLMRRYLDSHSEISAVACDGFILKNGRVVNDNSLMLNVNGVIEIESERSLFSYYFGLNSIRPAPFSAYMYRAKYLKKLIDIGESGKRLVAGYEWNNRNNLPAGKYSDVVFLSKVAAMAPVHWINHKLIVYRLHDDNDSNYDDIYSKLKLLNYYKQKVDNDVSIYGFFRFRIWLRWLFSKESKERNFISSGKKRIVLRYVVSQFLIYLITEPVVLLRIVKRIK